MGGEEGFEFLYAHCHIDRVLRGVNVKGAEDWVRGGILWGWCREEGRINWGYCNKFLLARRKGEY